MFVLLKAPLSVSICSFLFDVVGLGPGASRGPKYMANHTHTHLVAETANVPAACT